MDMGRVNGRTAQSAGISDPLEPVRSPASDLAACPAPSTDDVISSFTSSINMSSIGASTDPRSGEAI